MSSTQYKALYLRVSAGTAYFTLDRVSGLYYDYSITISGAIFPYVGTFDIIAMNVEDNEIGIATNQPDIYKAECNGTVTLNVQWISSNDVLPFLGLAPAEDSDIEWLEDCVTASNTWCYERRQAAGYTLDLPNALPNGRVRQGVIMKAAELYRSRGSIDGYSSFQQLEAAAPIASNADILRMLGLNKPGIG